MSNMMHVILYAIVPIIVVMLAGYISGKRGAFTGEDAKKFNKVVLVYALPAALFVSIVQASREMLARDIKLTLISLVGIMLCFMIVYWVFKYCFKKNTGADAAVSALISGSPTIGFLGFAVLEPIFGTNPSVALVVAIVGIVVNAVGIPVGLSLMNASLESRCFMRWRSQWRGHRFLQWSGFWLVFHGRTGRVRHSTLSRARMRRWLFFPQV